MQTSINTMSSTARPMLYLYGIALSLLMAAQTNAQPQTSIYTSLSERSCKKLKSTGDDYLGRCRGVAGFSLLLAEGDLRQNILVVTPGGARHSLELWSVVSPAFSAVGPKAEWRVTSQNQKPTPVGLIIRYNASEDPEKPEKKTSYLVVTKITASEICVTDKLRAGPNSNEQARRLADEAGTKPCLKAKD